MIRLRSNYPGRFPERFGPGSIYTYSEFESKSDYPERLEPGSIFQKGPEFNYPIMFRSGSKLFNLASIAPVREEK
jgi:hypothetical protein